MSATESVALLAFNACGEKVTLIVQVPPAARLVPHALFSPKSVGFVPAMLMLEIESDAVPVLVSVTCWAVLVAPTGTWPKASDVGESDTDGVPVDEATNTRST